MRWNLVRQKLVDSTNEVAKTLISEGAEPWTVVVADRQVAGKGRNGRNWASPRGGLYVSVIVREDLSRLPLVSLATGIATAQAIQGLGLHPTLKWPNDVLLGKAKVAGILVEGLSRPDGYWAVLGIGINSDSRLEALPEALQAGATTLRHELGKRVENEGLLQSLIESIYDDYPKAGSESRVTDRYREMCSTIGKDVRIQTSKGILEGRASGIQSQGLLVIETMDGRKIEVSEGTVLRQE